MLFCRREDGRQDRSELSDILGDGEMHTLAELARATRNSVEEVLWALDGLSHRGYAVQFPGDVYMMTTLGLLTVFAHRGHA